MVKPLWALTGIALLGTAGVVGAVVVASSGGEEELVQQIETATASPSAPTKAPSPTTLATPSPAPEPSPSDAPADWRTYVDPVLGFSLEYPADLELSDETGPSPVPGRRILNIHSADKSRVAIVQVYNENEFGAQSVVLEKWAVEFAACREDSLQQASLRGTPAISCNTEVVVGFQSPAIMAKHEGSLYMISHRGLSEAEFNNLIEKFNY